MSNEELTIVCASQEDPGLFYNSTYLGRSLARIPSEIRPSLLLVGSNSGPEARGLCEIYNEAIDTLEDDTNVLLVHDDVYINDWCIEARISEAVKQFDVVGLVGSVNPDLLHPSWGLKFDLDLWPTGWQDGLIRSGIVNHFDYGFPAPDFYGPTPRQCQLLDGLFIAGRVETWRKAGVSFDPAFRFHLYDLDFCRTATLKGLSIGTWPISVTHNSRGRFETNDFKDAAKRYLEKWQTHE